MAGISTDPHPAADLPSAAGTYLLIMFAPRDFEPEVGSLGRLALRRGWYCYTGSALGSGGLAARCGRHIRAAKMPRWHVDYLRSHLRLWAVWYAVGARRLEHEWAGALESRADMAPAWPGFGASDCRCTSHLWHGDNRPSLAGFRRLVGDPEIRRLMVEAPN